LRQSRVLLRHQRLCYEVPSGPALLDRLVMEKLKMEAEISTTSASFSAQAPGLADSVRRSTI
jgi:hypothetical protein